MANFGVITEQNDLGLGFDLLNDKDNQSVNEALLKKQDNKDQQIINEDKKK